MPRYPEQTIPPDALTPRRPARPACPPHGRARLAFDYRYCCIVLLLLFPLQMSAQPDVEYFKQNCMSCHTIGGGRLTGPDLKDVHEKRDRSWLLDFISDPQGMIATGDPLALQLLEESRGVIMPTLPSMTRARAEAMIALIEAESALEESQFKGMQISNRPFTAEDVETGRRLFTGEQRIVSGAASCISCHAVHGIGGFGGGTLAPDLTTIYERYENRTVLASWLTAPATPTMQSLFRDHPLTADEVLALTAYFEQTLQRNPADPSASRLNFLLLGLGGTVLLLGLFDVLWNRRFRTVRRALVDRMRHTLQPPQGNGVSPHE
ncbi:MAG: cytochrome c [Bacteroidetes bacterium]|nr:cytochrome c [Bacteroidota bacterium]